MYHEKLLFLSSESDLEEMKLSEVITSGSNLNGEGTGTTAHSSSDSAVLAEFFSSDPDDRWVSEISSCGGVFPTTLSEFASSGPGVR